MIEIPITQGKAAIIDEIDFELVSRYRWCAAKSYNVFYAVSCQSRDGKRFLLRMHNLIMNPPDGFIVDHADRDGLNNKRSNIRIATSQQNRMNSTVRFKQQSGYKGVAKSSKGTWKAQIWNHGRYIYLGNFANTHDAALAYNKAALEMYGEFAFLNEVEHD